MTSSNRKCTRPDPRPTDHRHDLPFAVSQRSSLAAELSVIGGVTTEGMNA